MRFSRLITTAALAASLVLAQRGPRPQGGPGGTPPDPAQMIQMRVDHMAQALGLTDQQKADVTRILTDAEANSANFRNALRDSRTQLDAAVKKGDTGAIESAALAIGSATGPLTAIQGKADAAVYALLTPDQKAKADQMPHGMGPGGPGGPMGRFGGMGPGFGRQNRAAPRQ